MTLPANAATAAATIGIACVALAAGMATAQTPAAIGTLVCTGGEGVGLIVGSKKSYDCGFTSTSGGPAERYAATVTKIGLDIGVTGKTTMVWSVLAASAPKARKALAGTYAGAVADASLGLGAGVKVLVGGSGNSFTLQPLSVQGQSGVNLALGVAELSLR